MIELFNIPQYNIDTSKFSNLLHDKIVEDLEREFAEYVGAKYACSANSASSLLFLLLLRLPKTRINIPSTIPVVVPNVITNTNHEICFYDDINWVGHHYRLCDNIIDSAQEVSRDIYKSMNDDNACMVFSFYPTKPVGSCDGGMLVSNDEHLISFIKTMTMNGTEINKDSWSRKQEIAGYKMHMNSIQAYIAQQNLRKLDSKNLALSKLRLIYNSEFGLENTSAHLYRIRVQNNTKFIQQMRANNIQCGIHYQHCHGKRYFSSDVNQCLPLSEKESMQTVSIPFHENLTMSDIEKVVTHVKRFR
jgi:dTDP-4-amino-4,6-dideoxygalactose transaminase